MGSLSVITQSCYAQSTERGHNDQSDELYKKVFGQKNILKEIQASAIFEERILGEIRLKSQGSNVLSFNRDDLILALSSFVYEEKILDIKKFPSDVIPKDFLFLVKFDPDEIVLELDIPESWIKPTEQSLLDDFIPYYSKKAIAPAPFSAQLNYKAEYVYQSNHSENNNIQGVVDHSLFLKGVVVDNSLTYQELRKENWYRENTVVTYDFQDRLTRFQLGDVNNNSIGFLQSKSLGGVSIFRDFSLNPYRVSYPTSRFEFSLNKRSLVRTYVNNLLIKSEYLNPGKHTIKDIPLNNGVNKILVEIEDEFGEKKILTFNEASSQDLLARGQSRFDLTTGKISRDLDNKKDYSTYKDLFYSSFFQYGHRKNLTLAGYFQGLGNYSLLGGQALLATRRGNLLFDIANSKNEDFTGQASRLTYQLNLFGPYWYDSHTFTARIEKRSKEFNETETKNTNFFDLLVTTNYSVPVYDALSASLGGNFSKSRVAHLSDKFGGDFSISSKLSNDATLTFSFARSRDERQKWQTLSYAFINFNIPEQSTYVSGFYDYQSRLKRITAIRDTGRKLSDVKLAVVAEEDNERKQASLDTTYNTQLVDVGVRFEHSDTKRGANYYRAIPRLLGGVGVVYEKNEWGMTVSRPMNGSFAIFKPHKEFKDQSFGIRSYGNDTESKTGLFDEALLTGMTPYQYRQVQLDPTYLEPGFSLGQESFVLYPSYKSGHLFTVGEAGQVALKGVLLDGQNNIVPYKVGYLIEVENSEKVIPFFSNKNGHILIEGVTPAKYRVQIEEFIEQEIDLIGRKGFVNFGNIKLMTKKEAL